MKILKTIALLLMISISLISCQKDNALNRSATKEFTHSGITYQIDNAVISSANANEHQLVFYTQGLSLNASKDDILGQGDMVYFTIYNSQLDGIYTYGNSNMKFNKSYCAINYNMATTNSTANNSIQNGTIEISPYSGGGYRISITAPVVNLIYEGKIELADFQ